MSKQASVSSANRVNVVNMKGLARAIALCYAAADDEYPTVGLVVLGPPGVGKTEATRAFAKERGLPYYEINGMMVSPEHISGVLCMNKDHTETVSLRPAMIPKLIEEGAVVVVEDFTNAPMAIQQLLYQLLLEKRAGDHKLPKRSLVALNGNMPEHKSGALAMNPVLANRAEVIYYPGPTWGEWDGYAEKRNADPDIRAFVAMNANILASYDGTADRNATPRSLMTASRLKMALGGADAKCDAFLRAMLAGAIGCHWAMQFVAWLEVRSMVTPFSEVIANPTKAKIPAKDDHHALHFQCGIVGTQVDVSNFDRVWPYIKRLPAELKVVVAKMAQTRLGGALVRCKSYEEFVNDKQVGAACRGTDE